MGIGEKELKEVQYDYRWKPRREEGIWCGYRL